MDHISKHKRQNKYELLEVDIEENLDELEFGDDILDTTPKA